MQGVLDELLVEDRALLKLEVDKVRDATIKTRTAQKTTITIALNKVGVQTKEKPTETDESQNDETTNSDDAQTRRRLLLIA